MRGHQRRDAGRPAAGRSGVATRCWQPRALPPGAAGIRPAGQPSRAARHYPPAV